jgi:hypothetical protein
VGGLGDFEDGLVRLFPEIGSSPVKVLFTIVYDRFRKRLVSELSVAQVE